MPNYMTLSKIILSVTGIPAQEWKNCWLSACVTWMNVADDLESAFWAAAKLREKIGEAYECLYYTPVS